MPLSYLANRTVEDGLDYQQSNIAAIEYDLAALPPEEHLRVDYLFMLRLYRELVENPLTPSCEQLFEAEVSAPTGAIEPVVTTFVERFPKSPGGHRGPHKWLRLSKESKKIGDRGEFVVYEYERAKVARLGFDPGFVKWLARDGETPGWDITSVDDVGAPIYIEVKACVGTAVQSLLITSKEWIAAGKYGVSYYIYLVTDVMKAVPKIEIIGNPAQLVELGMLQAETASWWLGLTSARVAHTLADPKEFTAGAA